MTKPWLVREIEQELRDHLNSDRYLELVKQLEVALAPDGESIVVRAVYQDDRTTRTTFDGNADVNDVDDIVEVTIEELTTNSEEVAGHLGGTTALSEIAAPFPEVTHRRGPAPALPWGGQWVPPLRGCCTQYRRRVLFGHCAGGYALSSLEVSPLDVVLKILDSHTPQSPATNLEST
ncbi:hypothetical protein QFZ57_002574 [Arthrobacter sp. B1I2]|nr:hypothetical protein [Arthrobacter sp. B1I2]